MFVQIANFGLFFSRVVVPVLLFLSRCSVPRTSPHTQVQNKFLSVLGMYAVFGTNVIMTVICLVFAGKLMSALLNGIHDRSTVVQKAFAFALGHLVRVSAVFH